MADEEQRHHFLLVAYGAQSHVNPGRALAHRLVLLGAGAGSDGGSSTILATLSVLVATHRRMFPSAAEAEAEETDDGVISYAPHSDGMDDGSMPRDAEDRARRRRETYQSLSAIAARLADRGRPVTCVICVMMLLPALDVARDLGIPVAVFWIQPATVLAATYHYFHGGFGGAGELIASHAADPASEPESKVIRLPGLEHPLQVTDLPSFLTDTTSELSKAINKAFQQMFEYMDQWRPKVLVNTLAALEPTVLAEMKQHLDVSAIGPMVRRGSSSTGARTTTTPRIHLFKLDDADEKRYTEWLQAQPERSVVYVSFGSISKNSKRQMEEIVHGLRRCGRPYLLVLRKDGLEEEDDDAASRHGLPSPPPELLTTATVAASTQDQGMVVHWCDQLAVLSHPAVGCFVSHCGWNSIMEGVASGVPIVGVPSMFDQPTNAFLVKEEWMIGTRAERDNEGILTGSELVRCIDLVMDDDEGAQATVIRERVKALKGTSQEVAAEGGVADNNLQHFVNTISKPVNKTI